MLWRAAGLFIYAAIGAGSAAQAMEHPPFLPMRDVVVAYQVQGTQMPAGQFGGDAQGRHNVRMVYSAASGRVRIEQSTLPGYMLLDPAAGRLLLVVEALQSFTEMPFDARAGAGLLLNEKMGFTRGTADKVAGLSCTNWDVTNDQTRARLCITQDGVILRGHGSDPRHGEGNLLATAVTYAPQPASMFNLPAGYHRIDLSMLPPALIGRFMKPPG